LTTMIRGSTLFGELFASVSVVLLDEGKTRLISLMSYFAYQPWDLQHNALVSAETMAGWSSRQLRVKRWRRSSSPLSPDAPCSSSLPCSCRIILFKPASKLVSSIRNGWYMFGCISSACCSMGYKSFLLSAPTIRIATN